MERAIAVQRASRADLRQVGATLGRAFVDDPLMAWLFGADPDACRDGSTRLLTWDTENLLRRDEVWRTPAFEAAALWAPPPGTYRPSIWSTARLAPFMLRSVGRRLPAALRSLSELEKARPPEPHWYLGVLGTDPAHQGRGFGSALLAPVLDRADEAGQASYLESSKEANLPFYERHGYRVLRTLDLADGPRLWTMWREPRPPGVGR